MIICLSGFVIAGSCPAAMPTCVRNDVLGASMEVARAGGVYSPQHLQVLQQFSTVTGGRAASSESVSSCGASPPLRPGIARVRTLYACLGESEGELSFEPNQIITNVCPSGEPGWLRGSLNGKSGLVPENYVEPLP